MLSGLCVQALNRASFFSAPQQKQQLLTLGGIRVTWLWHHWFQCLVESSWGTFTEFAQYNNNINCVGTQCAKCTINWNQESTTCCTWLLLWLVHVSQISSEYLPLSISFFLPSRASNSATVTCSTDQSTWVLEEKKEQFMSGLLLTLCTEKH